MKASKTEQKGMFWMPWKDRTVKELREEFAEAAVSCSNFSALCREYDITRRTGYKHLKRYQAGQSLSDQSRRPHHIPSRTPAEVEAAILQLREDNPGWGAKTIRCVLERQGVQELPCVKTVNNILKRNGCISPEESLKHQPYQRYEKEQCNDMWQTDFKGEFLTADNRYCYPLTILDDHSRFSIKIAPRLSTANVVIPAFEEAFREFGMPNSILSDNGAQFAGFRKGYTQFEKWLMNLDILPIHGRIKHPQTQGKIERFHRTMKQELLNHNRFRNIAEADLRLQLWREKYNNVRPHEALGMRCPSEVYEPSRREYRTVIPRFEYGGEYHVIKVNSWGYVRFDKWQVYLSETMIDEYIEFRPSADGESFIACYRNFKIASFDSSTGGLIERGIQRV